MSDAIDGVLVVDKPVGPTSHDIVACARRALGTSRVGHTGTLDPRASGVLPLVLGRATRLAQFLSGREKEYVGTIRFGVSTDTYDLAGTIVSQPGRMPPRADIEAALPAFRGTFQQVPPPHSAKKVGGVRAYRHARSAAPVQLKPAVVTVTELDLLDMEGPEARVHVTCSAGFYVRSLAHDLGEALGTGAVLASLARTRAGTFTLEHAVDVPTLTERREEALRKLVPMDALLPEIPAVQLTAEGAARARHGQAVGTEHQSSVGSGLGVGSGFSRTILVRLVDPAGRLVGMARPVDAAGTLRPSVVVS